MTIKVGIELELHQLNLLASAGYFIGLHIRFTSPLLTFQTYDQAWTDHYTERGYAMRDPMIAWGFSTTGSVRWSALPVPDTFGIMREATAYGMIYGAAVACGPLSSRTIAGASRSDREFTDEEVSRIETLIVRLHNATQPPEALTEAQVEALRLIAAGERHTGAAAKLGISESALKARLNSARIRLMARTTAEAIQRAKDYRLI
jgi:LuxR family transcriptional regulator